MKDVRLLAGKGLLTLTLASGLLCSPDSARGQGVTLLPPAGATTVAVADLPGRPMSLDQLIATMLMADPKLRVGYEEINQAVGDAITASLRPNPTFGTDSQLLPLNRRFTPQQQGGPPQFDALLNYPIDWFLFGKRKAAMVSAGIGVQQTEKEYYDLVRLRIREASSLYFDILELKALRDVAAQDVESLTKVEAIMRRAVENGGRPAVDANRIRLELAKSQQFLRDAELAQANAKARLRAILGRDDGDAGFDVSGTLDMPPPIVPMSTEEAIAIAQQNRPDLAALRLKIAKAEADTVVQQRKAYPEVTAKGGYSRQFQGSIGFRDADSYLLGVDIGLPIFDRNQGNRARASSLLMQSKFELQSADVELRSEIEQTLNEFRTAQRSAEAVAQEQLKLAEQVRDSINKASEAGGRPLLDVLDAQRNYRETYRIYITSRANFWRAGVRLNATLGKKVVP